MKAKLSFTAMLMLALPSLVFANAAVKSAASQSCLINVPRFHNDFSSPNYSAIEVESDNAESDTNRRVKYSGNVNLRQKNSQIKADELTLIQAENRRIVMSGNVNYIDRLINVKSSSAVYQDENSKVDITDSNYHLVDRLGRGTASKISYSDGRFVTLNNADFTPCPVDNSSWAVSGSKITYDKENERVYIKNAVFKVANVPVMYSPFFMLPTSDKRATGFLMPQFNNDTINGVSIELPLYLNIASNYDATITPNYMSNRGLQFKSEFRYLNSLGSGELVYDLMPQDALYKNDNSRWLFHFNHQITSNGVTALIDTTKVSDNQYFYDYSSRYGNESVGYLTQNYSISYNNDYFDIGINHKNITVLSDTPNENVYHISPRLFMNFVNSDFENFNFYGHAELSHFTNSIDTKPKTWRLHAEPTAEYNLKVFSSAIKFKASLLTTHYRQTHELPSDDTQIDNEITRIIPQLSVDTHFEVERDLDFFDGYKLSLDQRFKYIYVPFFDQTNIKNYDSSFLQSDVIGLYRENIFSGIDRIASANKLVTSLTGKIYNHIGQEKFLLNIGYIHEFSASRVFESESDSVKNKMTFAFDSVFNFSDHFIFKNGMQYNGKIDAISLANAVIEYKHSDNLLMQLTYRYANKKYINYISKQINQELTQNDISQMGVAIAAPLTENINLMGAWHYDLKNQQNAENIIGIEYNNCCWSVNIQYNRKLASWDTNLKKSQYNDVYSFGLNFRGLSNSNTAIPKMLNSGILPYVTALSVY